MVHLMSSSAENKVQRNSSKSKLKRRRLCSRKKLQKTSCSCLTNVPESKTEIQKWCKSFQLLLLFILFYSGSKALNTQDQLPLQIKVVAPVVVIGSCIVGLLLVLLVCRRKRRCEYHRENDTFDLLSALKCPQSI